MPRQEYPIRTRSEQIIEARTGKPIADLLRELYADRGLNQEQVARELGVNRTTVVAWMKRHGISAGYNRAALA